MSDESESTPKAEKVPAPAGRGKGGAIAAIFGIILPAGFAAASAYAAGRAGSRAAQPAPIIVEHVEAKPPGPTIPLDPFLVTIVDNNKKSHAMKVTLAVEFEHGAKEDVIKAFTPRIRDSLLSFLRALTYDDAVDGQHGEKLRHELLERCKGSGVHGAERVLITDMVIQ